MKYRYIKRKAVCLLCLCGQILKFTFPRMISFFFFERKCNIILLCWKFSPQNYITFMQQICHFYLFFSVWPSKSIVGNHTKMWKKFISSPLLFLTYSKTMQSNLLNFEKSNFACFENGVISASNIWPFNIQCLNVESFHFSDFAVFDGNETFQSRFPFGA